MKELNIEISRWKDNHLCPCVLMIDDLSDAYIKKYSKSERNDWGYNLDNNGSMYDWFKKNFLSRFPHVKITFFVPYARHSVINDNSNYDIKKHGLGERKEYSDFLHRLTKCGHEISYHGSNHGKYEGCEFVQEWSLFKSEKEATESVFKGLNFFYEHGFDINGGKYCGYKYNEFSLKSILNNNLNYWCCDAELSLSDNISYKNGLAIFPTNLAGNVFVRYTYIKENKVKDLLAPILYFPQRIINLFTIFKIKSAIKKGRVISIQEHYSPSTTRNIIQSCNLHSDITSLVKIFNILSQYSVWYSTCNEIVNYQKLYDSTAITEVSNKLIINRDSHLNISGYITLKSQKKFSLMSDSGEKYTAIYINGTHCLSLFIPMNSREIEYNIL